jgi:hypothetical protein
MMKAFLSIKVCFVSGIEMVYIDGLEFSWLVIYVSNLDCNTENSKYLGKLITPKRH